MRIAYVTMAVVALGLTLAAGDALFIAFAGFNLGVALLGAFIAARRERQGDAPKDRPNWTSPR